jgi:hypothetical protein
MDIIWNLLLQRGIPSSEIELYKEVFVMLILLPVVTTIIGIARYVIGTKSLGIFTPVIITFLLYEFGNNAGEQDIFKAIKYGLLLYVVTLVTSWAVYKLLKFLRMNYIPKLTLVAIGVVIAMFVSIIVAGIFGFNGPVFMNKFTLIIMALLVEPFVSAFARKGAKYGFNTAIDTFITALFCYIIISITRVQDFIETNLLIIPLLIIVNVYLGRFTGLRLNEYWRFRSILFGDNKIEDDKPKQNN